MGIVKNLLSRVFGRDEIEVHEGESGRSAAFGNLAEMLKIMEDAAAAHRDRGEQEALGDVLGNISQMKLDLMGDVEGAIEDLEERRTAYVSMGEVVGECDCLYALCSIRADQGERDVAQRLWFDLRERVEVSGNEELIEAAEDLREELGLEPAAL